MIHYNKILEDFSALYPEEGCGVLLNKQGKLEWHLCTNVSEQPETSFRIDPEEYMLLSLKGDIHAIVHSHTNEVKDLSEEDKKISDFLGIPYHLITIPEGNYIQYEPTYTFQPLIGREYKFMENDCWSLIRDYYKETLNIRLPTMVFEEHWWEKGIDYYKDCLEPFGFEDVTDLKVNDVILFNVMSEVPNHFGVYVGNDLFLHHAENRLSCRESIYSWWRKYIKGFIRCKPCT